MSITAYMTPPLFNFVSSRLFWTPVSTRTSLRQPLCMTYSGVRPGSHNRIPLLEAALCTFLLRFLPSILSRQGFSSPLSLVYNLVEFSLLTKASTAFNCTKQTSARTYHKVFVGLDIRAQSCDLHHPEAYLELNLLTNRSVTFSAAELKPKQHYSLASLSTYAHT